MPARLAAGSFAVALAALAGFETWNHESGPWPLAAALLPDVPRVAGRDPRALHLTTGPLALAVVGLALPRGHRLQVAALAWAAHVYAHRALGYDAREARLSRA